MGARITSFASGGCGAGPYELRTAQPGPRYGPTLTLAKS